MAWKKWLGGLLVAPLLITMAATYIHFWMQDPLPVFLIHLALVAAVLGAILLDSK